MSEALVPASKQYVILGSDLGALQESIRANLGDAGSVGVFDLDTIRVPAAGGQRFAVPSLEGEQEAKAIEGVVVAWKDPRAYWRLSMGSGGGANAPDCSSPDGVRGVGDPGGDCATCPMNQWGSAVGDDGKPKKGKACKEMRNLFIVRPSDRIPVRLAAICWSSAT